MGLQSIVEIQTVGREEVNDKPSLEYERQVPNIGLEKVGCLVSVS